RRYALVFVCTALGQRGTDTVAGGRGCSTFVFTGCARWADRSTDAVARCRGRSALVLARATFGQRGAFTVGRVAWRGALVLHLATCRQRNACFGCFLTEGARLALLFAGIRVVIARRKDERDGQDGEPDAGVLHSRSLVSVQN